MLACIIITQLFVLKDIRDFNVETYLMGFNVDISVRLLRQEQTCLLTQLLITICLKKVEILMSKHIGWVLMSTYL